MPGDPQEEQLEALPDAAQQEELTLSERGQEMTTQVYQQLGEVKADGLAHSLINAIGADDPEKRIDLYGRQNNIGEAASTVQAVYAHYQTHALAYLAKQTGEDGQTVLDWAMGEFDPDSFKQVARLQYFSKSMAGWQAIAGEYKKHRAKQRVQGQ